MKILASIRKFFDKGKILYDVTHNFSEGDNSGSKPESDKFKNSVPSEPGLEFLDGMSTGTARFIIEREINPDLLEKYDIKDLENKGRYYLAKIINQDGKVADTVLIDKLNRSIHFQKDRCRLD